MKKNLVSNFIKITLFSVVFLQCKKSDDTANSADIKWNNVFSDDFQRADGIIGSSYSVEVNGVTGESVNRIANIYKNQLSIIDSSYWAVWYANPVIGDTFKVSVKYIGKEEASKHKFGIAAKYKKLPKQWENEMYTAFVSLDTIAIQKLVGLYPVNLVSKYYKIQDNHTYKIELVVLYKDLTLNIEDITSGTKETLSATDAGTALTGTTMGVVGNNLTNAKIILFDDFLIEKGTK